MCLLGPGTFCMEHARRKYLRRHARLRTDVNDALIGLYGWNKGWFSSWSADFATTPPFPHNFPFSLFRCAVRFWVSLQFGLVKSTNAYSFGTSKTWIHINVSYTRVYHINVYFFLFLSGDITLYRNIIYNQLTLRVQDWHGNSRCTFNTFKVVL